MASRIPQQFIDEVLNRVDIVDIIGARIELRKRGQNHLARCPFHDEKTPSFNVNQTKQFYYCFGCGAGGSALQFLMQYEHLEFKEAIEQLAKISGLEVPTLAKENPQITQARQDIYQLLEQTQHWYSHYLKQTEQGVDALHYLQKRGLSETVIDQFQLGYAPNRWDLLIQHFPDRTQQLRDAGLLSSNQEGKEYDRFRGRVMFPISDLRGRVVGFGARVLDDSKPKYLNSPETEVFQKSQLLYGLYQARKHASQLNQLIVVEGYMDVISLAQHGIHYAVATMGTAIGEPHIQLMMRQVNDITFCFDGDQAGRNAAFKALEVVLPVIKDECMIKFLFLPQGEDPDTFVQQQGRKAFEQEIKRAPTFSEFFIKWLTQQVDLSKLEGRARLSVLARPYLKRINPSTLKDLLVEQIAKLATVTARQLLQTQGELIQVQPEFRAPKKQHQPSVGNTAKPLLLRSARLGLLHRHTQHEDINKTDPLGNLIALLILRPELAQQNEITQIQAIEHPNIDLLQTVWQLLKDNPDLSSGALLGRWYGTDYMPLLSSYLTKIQPLLNQQEHDPSVDFQENIKQLKIENLDQQIQKLNQKKDLTVEEQRALSQLLAEQSALKSRHNPD